MIFQLESIQKVAVVDDDTEQAKMFAWYLQDAGYEPFIVPRGPYTKPFELLDVIKENSQAAICDHRLGDKPFANFLGSVVVAALYEQSFPAILVTQYVSDASLSFSIRGLRRKIPVLLTRNEADGDTITKGLGDCIAEFNGQMPYTRRTYRTLIRIVGIDSGSGDLEAIIPGWNPHEVVRFPRSIVPHEIQNSLKKELRLVASVNIGAEKSDDLFFEQFELPLEPDDDELT